MYCGNFQKNCIYYFCYLLMAHAWNRHIMTNTVSNNWKKNITCMPPSSLLMSWCLSYDARIARRSFFINFVVLHHYLTINSHKLQLLVFDSFLDRQKTLWHAKVIKWVSYIFYFLFPFFSSDIVLCNTFLQLMSALLCEPVPFASYMRQKYYCIVINSESEGWWWEYAPALKMQV